MNPGNGASGTGSIRNVSSIPSTSRRVSRWPGKRGSDRALPLGVPGRWISGYDSPRIIFDRRFPRRGIRQSSDKCLPRKLRDNTLKSLINFPLIRGSTRSFWSVHYFVAERRPVDEVPCFPSFSPFDARISLRDSRAIEYAPEAFSHGNPSTPGARVMDDTTYRRFFLEPDQTSHRRYEALRAIFVEGLPLNQVADRFGYRPSALRSLVSRFRSGCRAATPPPFSFSTDRDAPPAGNCARTKAVRNSPKSPTVVC